MNSTKGKNKKTEEGEREGLGKKEQAKNNNYIVEYVVSLSGVESEKIYIKHDLLGRGGFANCYITQLMGSNELMATKIIDKANLKSSRSRLRVIIVSLSLSTKLKFIKPSRTPTSSSTSTTSRTTTMSTSCLSSVKIRA